MGWNSNNPKDAPVGDTRTQLVRRGLLAAMAVGLALALVTSGTPTVGADGKGPKACSNRTLRGDYGFDISGTIILPSPAPSFLLRGLAMTHFDGHGSLSQVDFVTHNGVPVGSDWRPATGSYELNADCTGTAEIHFDDGSPSLNLRLVVVDGGRQVSTIVEGQPTGSTGIKVR
jgi:hypothetical protein